MEYQSIRIVDIIRNVNKNNWFLPAIQREFVWGPEQIERLFDSIMADFPIGSFLLWKVENEHKGDWSIYKFISKYDKESPHNEQENMERSDLLNKDITLVLDGQQRITSLLIGLQGSYCHRRYRRLRVMKLHLNLLKKFASKYVADDEDSEALTFDFKFKENDTPSDESTELWYPVGDILSYPNDPEDAKSAMKERLAHLSEEQRENALKLIGRLHSHIHLVPVGFYYEEKTQDYDKALQVFVRANSGGTPLEYSDLLLSTATAQWEHHDARDEIHQFTDSLNTIIRQGGFFKKDFVLKACLYLCEDLRIQYKVKNFTKENLRIIENNWKTIQKSLEDTVHLILRFGFDSKNIVAQLALLPIAFYLLKKGEPNFHTSIKEENLAIQVAIRKWFMFSTLKNAFGGSSDTTLTRLRELLKKCDSNAPFPADKLYKSLAIEPSLTDADIEDFLKKYQYGQRYTGLVLALLYPDRNWIDVELHQDHIFPQAEFNKTNLKKRGYEEAKIVEYMSCLHKIPNLELLPKSENLRKGAKNFSDWLKESDDDYRSRHLIPGDHQDYELDHFLDFFEKRKSLITKKLKEL